MSLSGSQMSQQEHASPIKTPIILAKHEKSVPSGGGETRTAGRLWKPTDSESRAAGGAKHGIPTLLQSGELPAAQPAYKIQQRNDVKPSPGSDWTKSTLQKKPVKLIDGLLNWCGEPLAEFLRDSNEYRVIGVLGTEGSGKTYIMNLLATFPTGNSSPFQPEPNGYGCGEFGHTTQGINAYITSERVILLDCQPVFSSSVLEDIISNERKMVAEYSNREDTCDAANIQLAMFMMSVCHIVLVVENWFTDPNLHRLLQTVEMLRPPQLPNEKSDERHEFTSRIVFVHNMRSLDDLDTHETNIMEDSLTKMYRKSSLSLLRHASNNGNIRMFLLGLRSKEETTEDDSGSSICQRLERKFVQEIMAMSTMPILGHTTLSEKNWLQYSTRMWDAVYGSPFISEYMRLQI